MRLGLAAVLVVSASLSGPPVASAQSVERLRRLLDEHPAAPALLRSTPPQTPTFRVEINAPKPFLPDFAEQMRRALAQRGPSFTVAARRPVGVDVLWLIATVRAARYRAEVERERREVAAELAVISARWEARQAGK